MLLAVLICLLPLAAQATDMCGVAADIAEKGRKVFQTDQVKGIKLMVKARSMCSKPVYSYNLGQAYFIYGNTGEAVTYLKKAVQADGSNPKWLNNLAYVLLETGDPEKALEYAEKAVSLDVNYKSAADTRARALFMSGERLSAIKKIKQAFDRWPESQPLADSKSAIVSRYTRYCLNRIKNGDVDTGLEGLKKAVLEPDIAETYCRALIRLDQLDRALTACENAMQRFGKRPAFKALRQEVFSRRVQQFYVKFKKGEPALALQEARAFHEAYPGSKEARKAYDDLFDAYTSEALGTVTVPEVDRTARESEGTQQSDRVETLLSDIGDAPEPGSHSTNLTVDVDQNIPAGSHRNEHGVAVVLANQSYEEMNRGISDVKYARRDGRVMKKYLERTLGYDPDNIIYMEDLTSGDFRSVFGSRNNPEGMIHQWIRSGKSDLFIYYVGHGSPGQDGNSAYLVPVDARADYIENNGYPLDLLYSAVKDIPATRVTVVMDACFSGSSASGPLFKNISPGMLKTVSPVRDIKDTAVFCAAGKDQVATWYPEKRHSLFTYYFLKGLQGSADTDRDKQITLSEMSTFLKEEVSYMAGRVSGRSQDPLIKGDRDTVIARLK